MQRSVSVINLHKQKTIIVVRKLLITFQLNIDRTLIGPMMDKTSYFSEYKSHFLQSLPRGAAYTQVRLICEYL